MDDWIESSDSVIQGVEHISKSIDATRYLSGAEVGRLCGVSSQAIYTAEKNKRIPSATKDGDTISFAIKSALVVEKNHITNVQGKGKVLCTDQGFIEDDPKAIADYKDKYKSGWDLEYDKFWDKVSLD